MGLTFVRDTSLATCAVYEIVSDKKGPKSALLEERALSVALDEAEVAPMAKVTSSAGMPRPAELTARNLIAYSFPLVRVPMV